MNRMHVISIPYSLMKVNPLSWIQKVHMYKGGSQYRTKPTPFFVTLLATVAIKNMLYPQSKTQIHL